jgi:tripartite-type tricarboxylate transporter receptor subunit TctC
MKLLGKIICCAITAMAALTLGGLAQAQTFPERPVTIVVPFPPAGGADTLARILSTHLGAQWKQQVIVENRPGASGHIGAAYVARSAPDGTTLMMSSTASLDYKNLKQFAPVALVSASPYVVVVNPRLGVSNIRELIALAKAQPGKLSFGSSGEGSASHLTVELFKQMAGVELLHVPYKGTGQAVSDLLGGTISLMFAPGQAVLPHVKAGKLQALAVTSSIRAKAAPDLPTMAEAGLPGYSAVGWFGLLAPADTPKAVVDKLSVDVNAALQNPAIEKNMLASGAEPANISADEFGRFIVQELDKWSALEKVMGNKK